MSLTIVPRTPIVFFVSPERVSVAEKSFVLEITGERFEDGESFVNGISLEKDGKQIGGYDLTVSKDGKFAKANFDLNNPQGGYWDVVLSNMGVRVVLPESLYMIPHHSGGVMAFNNNIISVTQDKDILAPKEEKSINDTDAKEKSVVSDTEILVIQKEKPDIIPTIKTPRENSIVAQMPLSGGGSNKVTIPPPSIFGQTGERGGERTGLLTDQSDKRQRVDLPDKTVTIAKETKPNVILRTTKQVKVVFNKIKESVVFETISKTTDLVVENIKGVQDFITKTVRQLFSTTRDTLSKVWSTLFR